MTRDRKAEPDCACPCHASTRECGNCAAERHNDLLKTRPERYGESVECWTCAQAGKPLHLGGSYRVTETRELHAYMIRRHREQGHDVRPVAEVKP